MNPRTSIADLRLQSSPNLSRALRRKPVVGKMFAAGVPEIPSHLGAAEREVWDRVVTLLEARGTLTEADRFVIEKYCVLYVRWRTEQEVLNNEGTMIEVVKILGKDHNGVI